MNVTIDHREDIEQHDVCMYHKHQRKRLTVSQGKYDLLANKARCNVECSYEKMQQTIFITTMAQITGTAQHDRPTPVLN